MSLVVNCGKTDKGVVKMKVKVREKQVMYKYFDEYCYLYDWLQEHKEYKMVKYNFTFAYGYQLQYTEK